MKIDELIKYYEWRLEQTKDFSDPHWEASERREHREFVERLETIISLLNELQWYREQDLVERQAVIDTIATQTYICDYCPSNKIRPCFEEKCDEAEANVIKAIPKAEYRGDDNG